MVERGEVALDDPVERFLPDSVSMPTLRGVEITLEDLATHVSGLPENPERIAQNNPVNPFLIFSGVMPSRKTTSSANSISGSMLMSLL